MEKVTLEANSWIIKALFFVILVGSISLLAGSFFKLGRLGAPTPDFFLWLITGVILFTISLGYFTGWLRTLFPAVIADSEGIRTENTGWQQSAHWCDIKCVELGKGMLRVQYTRTGSFDTYKFPTLLQIRDMDDFYEFIEEECKTRNIEVIYEERYQSSVIRSFSASAR